MTALIQRAVGRLSIGYEFAGMGEVGDTWFADDGAFLAESIAGLQLFFDVAWVVTRIAGLDLITKPDGSKTAWSGVVKLGPIWTPLEGKWTIKLPDGKVVPWVGGVGAANHVCQRCAQDRCTNQTIISLMIVGSTLLLHIAPT